jgi:hypothetical protein
VRVCVWSRGAKAGKEVRQFLLCEAERQTTPNRPKNVHTHTHTKAVEAMCVCVAREVTQNNPKLWHEEIGVWRRKKREAAFYLPSIPS